MDLRLLRRPHPKPLIHASGAGPSDPYLEWCWGPVVGPSVTALLRRVDELTAATGEARLPFAEMGRLLGLGAVDEPTKNNKLLRTLTRAEHFGLAFTSVDGPGAPLTFGIYEQVALVPFRQLDRLPDVARQRHVAEAERVAQRLADSGLTVPRTVSQLGRLAVDRDAAAPAGPQPTPLPPSARPARRTVSPIARLDALDTPTHPPLEQSL